MNIRNGASIGCEARFRNFRTVRGESTSYRKDSMTTKYLAAALVMCTAAFCQSDAKRPEFEVASIKPAPPPTGNNLRVMMGGDPGRVNMSNITIRDMIRQA